MSPNAPFFGSPAAAPLYTCRTRVKASLAARISKIPRMGYFGELGFVVSVDVTEGALLACAELKEILGFALKLSNPGRGQILELLGLIFDLPSFPSAPAQL